MREAVDEFSRRRPVDDAVWASFAEGLSYVRGDFTDADAYATFNEQLATLDQERGTLGNRLLLPGNAA